MKKILPLHRRAGVDKSPEEIEAEVEAGKTIRTCTCTRYAIRQGGELQWGKWEQDAKAALRPQYRAQVDSITRVLREEEHPLKEPEFSSRALNTAKKIEFNNMSQQKFDAWKKGAETRRDIRVALPDHCTQQVRSTRSSSNGD